MTTEFKKHHGWNSSHIGWFWGGMTVQGILPYYYRRVSQPADRLETVDRCYYNTMADTPECNLQKIEELKSAHFTVCQKPWGCWEHYFRTNNKENPLCYPLHQRWVQLRKEAEVFYGLVPSLDQAQVKFALNYLCWGLPLFNCFHVVLCNVRWFVPNQVRKITHLCHCTKPYSRPPIHNNRKESVTLLHTTHEMLCPTTQPIESNQFFRNLSI